jgi:hypothetical protein
LIQVLPRTIPVDLAALFIDRILNRRLVVTRTPGATEYSPRVQVMLDTGVRHRDGDFPKSGWSIQEREGGDLAAWRDLLAMTIRDIALEAMKEMQFLENSPAVPADHRRTAWRRLVEED